MLVGRQISLRPLRREDLGQLHASSLDLENRGPWYPLPRSPLGKFEAATEALGLLSGWLFDSGHMNRLRANVHVDNKASRRVAEKCGFTLEATARAAWYNRGQWHDVAVFTLTREEFEALRKTAVTPA